jgi:hypothetical protein
LEGGGPRRGMQRWGGVWCVSVGGRGVGGCSPTRGDARQ